MAKHDQKGDDEKFVCSMCKQDLCEFCIDVKRAIYSKEMICRCKRKAHAGEPRDQQILDPVTNDVHTPGLIISESGTVTRR